MLCDRIKELRQAKHITQVDLANALNLTKQCISNWENNNILPSIEMLCKLADYFNVSTDYLLCREEAALLKVTGLTATQISHVQDIINDIKDSKKQ